MNPEKLPVKPYAPNLKLKQATDALIVKMERDVERMRQDPFFNQFDLEDIRAEMEKERDDG